MGLKRIRRRLVRVEKDVEEIVADLERYGEIDVVAKAQALKRVKDLEAALTALRKHSTSAG